MVALWVLLFGLVVWDAGCAKPESPAKPAVVDVYAAPRAAVVEIERWCDGKPSGAIGTGLAVSAQDVVTVAHVATCDKGVVSARVRFADGSIYPMQISKVIRVPNIVGDYADGWARFTTMNDAAFKADVLEPVLAFPKVGESICSLNAVPKIGMKCGKVQSLNAEGKPTFAMTLGVEPGNSGSPVLDSNGKLVGFVEDCWTDGNHNCYPAGGDALISMGIVFL